MQNHQGASNQSNLAENLLQLMKIPSLSVLQNYRNEFVILDIHAKNPEHTLEQVRQYFQDLLAWLWLHQHRKIHHKNTWMFGPLLILDTVWHHFILHTRDYHAFCAHFFGEYIHHDVEPAGQEHILTPDELADFLEDGFLLLGAEWVDRHFSHLYERL